MQAETEGREFTRNMPQSENSTESNALEVHGASQQQNLPEANHRDDISQQRLAQLQHDQLTDQRLSHISQENLRETSSQETLHGMNEQGQLLQMSAMQIMSTSQNPHMEGADIAAPEVRTRVRSQEPEIILLQSTFTQTLPLPAEPKKVCQSVAVQTQLNSDYEPQAYSVITGDGSVSYDSDGVRVLRAIGTWTPNYQGADQFVDQNSEVFLNGSTGTVSSPDNSMIQQSVSSSPNSAGNCMSSAQIDGDSSEEQHDQSGANKLSPGDKTSFVCPVCNKTLARKDKLVIHMRIHTGEKPYVCEVCERAFARRDKLVMHMNKLKHVTPSNFAPLGKRQHHQSGPGLAVLPEKRQDLKMEAQEMGSPASSVDIQPATLVQVVHEQPAMTWNCELCGRICISREEWTAHARSHLDGDHSFGSSSVSTSLSVLTPLSSYQFSGAPPDRQTCVVCRLEFPSKTDLILHLRTHFVGKPELLANHVASLTDSSGVC